MLVPARATRASTRPHRRHHGSTAPRRARARRAARGCLRDPRHPPARGRRRRRASASTSCASCSRTRAPSPSARPASTSSATTRRTTASSTSSTRSSSSPPSSESRSSSTPAPPTPTRSPRSRTSTATVVLHCFSSPRLLEPALERGYYVSFAGNVTYPNAPELRVAAARSPATASSPRPTARTSRRSRVAGARTSRPTSSTRSRRSPRRAARSRPQLAAQIDANAATRLRPAVIVVPKKRLGQHFLADENILGVIGRLAELAADDVVLEVGPGLGVLTRYLADRVAHVHAVELDRSLEPHLAGARHAHERRPRLRRRARARPRRARPGADEARRQPALQRRHAAHRREPRRHAELGSGA